MLSHHGRRHGEQNAIRIHQANLRSLAHKGHWLPLHYRNANLAGKQAHDRGSLDPGNLLQLLAALGQRHMEDVAPNIFTKDRQHLSAANLSEAVGLNIACLMDAESLVALQKLLEKNGRGCTSAQDNERGQRERDAARCARRTPPGIALCSAMQAARAAPAILLRILVAGIVHLQRHTGQ